MNINATYQGSIRAGLQSVSSDDVEALVCVDGVALLAALLLLAPKHTHRRAALEVLHKCCVVC